MEKKHLFGLLLLLFSSLFAQRNETSSSRLIQKHRESQGLGYHHGYTTTQLFSAIPFDSSVVFTDFRGHLFNTGKAAANMGIGYRYNFEHPDLILGLNGYYDLRQGRSKLFHQLGAGIECLSSYLDLRVNGYFPLGSREENLHCMFYQLSPTIFTGVRKFHKALTGVDGEIGRTLFCHKKISCYAAGGFYYFEEGKCQTNLGVKGRLKAYFGDFFSLEALLTHDKVFQTKFQGEAALCIPLYPHHEKKSKKNFCEDHRWNLPTWAQLPERNEMIVLARGTQKTVAQAWVSDNKVLCQTFFSSEPVFENEETFKTSAPTITEVLQEIREELKIPKTEEIPFLQEPSAPIEPTEIQQPSETPEEIETAVPPEIGKQEEEKGSEPFVLIENINEEKKVDEQEKFENDNIPAPQTPQENFFLNRFLRYIQSILRGK